MRDVTIDFGKQLEFAHGRLDPTDIATKVVTPLQLKSCDIFFQGPSIYFPKPEWPNLNVGDNFTISNNLHLVLISFIFQGKIICTETVHFKLL